MLLSDEQIRYTFLAYKDIESPPKGEYLQVRQHRAIAKAQLQAVVDDLNKRADEYANRNKIQSTTKYDPHIMLLQVIIDSYEQDLR